MLSKRDSSGDNHSTGELNTIIGRGSIFEGSLKIKNSMRVDGKITGSVEVNDSLIVGKEGEIEGEVRARNAVIGGKVQNNILVSGKVVLEAQSIVRGEVITARLVIDEGAIFEGKCKMANGDGKKSAMEKSRSKSRTGSNGMEVLSKQEMATAR